MGKPEETITQPAVLCNADLAELREKMGCSVLDMYYILGRTPPLLPMSKGEKAHLPIKNLPLSYLSRLLWEEPEMGLSVLADWPTHEDAFKAVTSVWDHQTYGRLSGRKFAIMCGVTPWTYAKWVSGENVPTTTTVRLFRFLCDIIRLKGHEGFKLYLKCLDDDARSRGLSGLKELFKTPPKKEKESEAGEE